MTEPQELQRVDPHADERKVVDAFLTAMHLYNQYLGACGVGCHSVTIVFGIAALNEKGQGVSGGDIISLDQHGREPLVGSRFRGAVAAAVRQVTEFVFSDAVHKRFVARKKPPTEEVSSDDESSSPKEAQPTADGEPSDGNL